MRLLHKTLLSGLLVVALFAIYAAAQSKSKVCLWPRHFSVDILAPHPRMPARGICSMLLMGILCLSDGTLAVGKSTKPGGYERQKAAAPLQWTQVSGVCEECTTELLDDRNAHRIGSIETMPDL